MASEQTTQARATNADDALREVRRRLVSIHYGLAEGPHGDRELQRQTRERLMELLAYVNDAIDHPAPGSPTP